MTEDVVLEPETVTKTATFVPSHGNGALLQGGQIGNRGGRPKSAIRRRAQETFDDLLGRIREDIKANKLSPNERIKAAELMLKAGMGELKEVSVDKDQFLEAVADVFAVEPDLTDAIAVRLYDAIVERLKDF